MIRISRAWAVGSGRNANPHSVAFNPSPFRPSPMTFQRRRTTTKCDTQHPCAQAAPQTSKTIPGPTWLWLEPIYEPFRAYGRAQRRRPYMTQFLSSLTVYFVGDLVAQSIGKAPAEEEEVSDSSAAEEDESKGWVVDWAEDRDWARTVRALLIGGISAVPGYKWFLWLSNSFNYRSKILSLTTKVTVNQLLFTPIFNSYFFGMQFVLTTHPSDFSFADLFERLQNTVPTSWINSCKLWPAVTAFSFSFIPIEYRSIFGGVIAIGWQTYLSLLNQRAEKVEEIEHHHHGGQRQECAVVASAGVERDDGKEKCAA